MGRLVHFLVFLNFDTITLYCQISWQLIKWQTLKNYCTKNLMHLTHTVLYCNITWAFLNVIIWATISWDCYDRHCVFATSSFIQVVKSEMNTL